MTATVQPRTIPLRLVCATPRHHQRRRPVIALSWRVMGPNGRTLGWVQLTYARAGGRFAWSAAAPRCRWLPIRPQPRRGRDAVAALLAFHGVTTEGDRS